MAKELHVFEMSEGPDTVIAESPEDAIKVWCEVTGEKVEDFQEDYGDEFIQVPDDKSMKIYDDENRRESTTMLAKEWVEREGRGWLCSTEC